MKQILIGFLVLFVYVNSDSIYKTVCADDKLKIDACSLTVTTVSGTDTTYTEYVKGCSGGKECDTKDGVGVCVKDPFKDILLDFDKECNFNEECKSGVCTNNKCAYLATGTDCNDDNNCGYLNRCAQNDDGEDKCFEGLKKDAACDASTAGRCGPGLACGDSKCVKMYTQEAGTKTFSEDACKSGTTLSFENSMYCASVTLKEGGTCDGSSSTYTLKLTAGEGKEEERNNSPSCIRKPDGTYGPDNYRGSTEWNKYVEEYVKEADKMEPEDYEDIKSITSLDKKSLYELYIDYYFKTEIGGDECIRDYYLTKDNASYYSFSMWLVLLFAMLV